MGEKSESNGKISHEAQTCWANNQAVEAMDKNSLDKVALLYVQIDSSGTMPESTGSEDEDNNGSVIVLFKR